MKSKVRTRFASVAVAVGTGGDSQGLALLAVRCSQLTWWAF